MSRPFLSWVGGKTRIIQKILPLIPDTIKGDYYEPFIGGGSVLIAVLQNKTIEGNVYASDINTHVIELYKTVQNNPEELVKNLINIANKFKKLGFKEEYYREIRDRFNNMHKSILKDAMFLFLNKLAYRSTYHEKKNGDFSSSFGSNKSRRNFNNETENILSVSKLIKNVIFSVRSYDSIHPKKNDFMYLDPPYVKTKTTLQFDYGNNNGFDNAEFFEWCHSIPCKWLMSNSFNKYVKESFDSSKYKIITIQSRTTLRNVPVKEYLILKE